MDDAAAARCPRCADEVLTLGYGALREDVCTRCRGRFLPPEGVERVIVDENGVSHAMMRELLPLFASQKRIACPACATRMSALVLRDVRIDLCTGCGGAWFDAGELTKLGHARYPELTPGPAAPAAAPMNDGAPSGTRCVFLTSLDPIDGRALVSAFARCPGLTEQDAWALARNNNGVVVDGVSAGTADAIARALTSQGIDARAVDDAWTSLPPPARADALHAGPEGLTLGSGADQIVIAWRNVGAVAAGYVRRTEMSTTTLVIEPTPLLGREPEFGVIETDDPIFEVVVLDPIKRVRCALSTQMFGENGARLALFTQRVAAVGRVLDGGVGRGVRASMNGDALPLYRSIRDLEREEAWLLWSRSKSDAR